MSKRKFDFTPNVTQITKSAKSIEKFPNLKTFLEILVKNTEIQFKKVGREFNYHPDIVQNRYYPAQGTFVDYFIRKHLSNQYNIEITDHRAEVMVKQYLHDSELSDLCGGMVFNHSAIDLELQKQIVKHYKIFQDPTTQAMDIVESIKFVSLAHSIYFGDRLPDMEKFTIDNENLLEIVKYFQNNPYKMVDLNPTLGCEYFRADADLIFDNDIIVDIKNSKNAGLLPNVKTMRITQFYQHIIYSFGFYKKTGKMIKKFKIYNPLLGNEHSIELKNIDFDLFEEALTKDMEAYSDRVLEARDSKRPKIDQSEINV